MGCVDWSREMQEAVSGLLVPLKLPPNISHMHLLMLSR